MIRPDVDLLMIPTSKAIKKHVKDRDAFTEIYNRAYEAVMISMEVKEAERNKLAEAVGLMTTLKPTMVVDSAHPVEMALEVSEYITQLTAELADWKADAERLIQLANFNNARAGEYFDLHEQLAKNDVS